MLHRFPAGLLGMLALVATGALVHVPGALAHCDGLDGPVVTSARAALQEGDVGRVLVWVRERDEAEIRAAFRRALAVRKLGGEAREMADLYFFETLVRVHRAGEGEPYTGLEPAGRDLGPAIPAADQALATGDAGPLVRMMTEAIEGGLRQRFEKARASRDHPAGDVLAGRRYVSEYVPFIHYVERLYQAAIGPVEGHHEPRESEHP
jgi:hypothetical protein